jgi:uncharacterized coiled-coil protein SlyX
VQAVNSSDVENPEEEPDSGDATPRVQRGENGVQRPVSGENERLADLERRVDAQSDGLSSVWEVVDELQEENEKLRERLQELTDDVEQLDARTDLLRVIEDADELTGRQRSTVLLQHLQRQAERKRDRGQPAKASVDRDQAEAALQYPDVERTTIYRDMERAARLVGNDDVCWYESAGHGQTWLKLDLERAELMTEIAGGDDL